ncbi:hypothetical protein GQ44DRAFT_827419 [Phaeosphaeriaceae sp. PMI808]|nr:hypothetical protein GQ44DRAFT_827419 [Phaeosphaeriaceae sp. PMI808]
MFYLTQVPTTIDNLPNELLIEICAKFTHLKRNEDLSNLALVSRKWRPFVYEQLMKVPQFHIKNIALYLWELGRHQYLSSQVRSLEIFSSSEDRIRYSPSGRTLKKYHPVCFPQSWMRDTEFIQKCSEFISEYSAHYAMDSASTNQWTAAIHDDCIPALFGILIATLPNLKELRLGHAWLMDFPIFAEMVSPTFKLNPIAISPWTWPHSFMATILTPHLSRLNVLEVPADFSSVSFTQIDNTVYDFRPFRNLKEVGITMKALWWPSRSHRFPPDPREIFSDSLEILRISEATADTPKFLQNLCTAKAGKHFPALRRVEVYYMHCISIMQECKDGVGQMHPVTDVRKMFRKASLELFLYAPTIGMTTWDTNGLPWVLNEGKILEEVQQDVYGYEPDPDGTLVQVGRKVIRSQMHFWSQVTSSGIQCLEDVETEEALAEKRTENDSKFMDIMCGILKDDPEAVLDSLVLQPQNIHNRTFSREHYK